MWIGKFLFILLCFVSGCGQNTNGLEWHSIESIDAGLRASMPCTAKLTRKSFQDQPRPIHDFGFDCEIDGIRFLLSVINHQNEFTSKTSSESFESNEFLLKGMFGEIERFSIRKDFTTNGFESRDYDVETKAGGKVRSLIVVNDFATYQALIGVTPENINMLRQKKLDFAKISGKFFGSVEILNK